MRRFARQQCRAWIETRTRPPASVCAIDSPGSNAGRGLKQPAGVADAAGRKDSPGSNAGRGLKRQWPYRALHPAYDSPGSNAGRGLKLDMAAADAKRLGGFARQQCRAWIETVVRARIGKAAGDSPGSNAGRGLKRRCQAPGCRSPKDSPGSNAGRGLKLHQRAVLEQIDRDSPGSNAGRGLKHAKPRGTRPQSLIRVAAGAIMQRFGRSGNADGFELQTPCLQPIQT